MRRFTTLLVVAAGWVVRAPDVDAARRLTVFLAPLPLALGIQFLMLPAAGLGGPLRGATREIPNTTAETNIAVDEQGLRQGGSIATYAAGSPNPAIPFWPLVFKNVSLFFLGSDDFTVAQKERAAADLSAALAQGWTGYSIARRYALDDVALAHQAVERRSVRGRVVLPPNPAPPSVESGAPGA